MRMREGDENFIKTATLCSLNSMGPRRVSFLFEGRVLQLALCFVAISLSAACSCEKKMSGAPAEQQPIPALVDLGAPTDIKIEIYPAIGTKVKRPVALVLAGNTTICETVRNAWRTQAHVLCLAQGSQGPADEAEKVMKQGLSYVKSKYERYLSGSPVLLFAEPRYAQLGFQLMLREPRVFGHAFLPGFDPAELGTASVYALFNGGAKTLILGKALGTEQAPLRSMSARAGLAIHAVGEGPEALDQALKLLKNADPRLQSP